jgi:ABC-type dipeptide/oligopeptide/nickel transport systems, permease components
VRRYFARKLITYTLTFFAAVTIDWTIPHLMPGDPILTLLSRIQIQDPKVFEALYNQFAKSFRTDLPLWKQYYYFWVSLFHGDLGVSIMLFPTKVTTVIERAAPYTLALLIPAILLSWYAGNKVGAMAARRKILDNTVLPVSYGLTASPYMWIAMIMSWTLASQWKLFPNDRAYDVTLIQSWSPSFIANLAYHWFLPFLSLFLVSFGGWAIGMRNMIIYELESDYSHYLEALGAPRRLVRKYAFRNAMLPQITGLALAIGAILAGALVTEIVFSYPGLGSIIYQAIITKDFFVIQGVFLFIIVGVLVANFIVDIVYVLVDPRTRIGMQGGQA